MIVQVNYDITVDVAMTTLLNNRMVIIKGKARLQEFGQPWKVIYEFQTSLVIQSVFVSI